MADDRLRKLRENKGTVTVSLPKDDLRASGILDGDDELDSPAYAKVDYENGREFSIEVLDL